MAEQLLLVPMTLFFILYALHEAKKNCLCIVSMCLVIAAILCSMSLIWTLANMIAILFERC